MTLIGRTPVENFYGYSGSFLEIKLTALEPMCLIVKMFTVIRDFAICKRMKSIVYLLVSLLS